MKNAASVFPIVALLSLALAVLPTAASALQGETIVVTSPADSGPGTLRQSLLDAQSGDTITFDPAIFPPTTPVTITVTTELPHIHQGNLTIGGSNAGVILDGSSFPHETWILGLQVHSSGNTIRGLQIVNFPGPGIGLFSGSRNNTIGGDRAVGAAPLGQANLISRNGNVGILVGDSSYNTIRGNYIGAGPTGTEAWGNRYDGVFIDGGSHNQITDNLISDNGAQGVGLQGSESSGNIIRGNTIGTDASGMIPLGNHNCGISFSQGAGNNTVGPDNVIAYNDLHGVQVEGPDLLANTITRNSIHHNGEFGIGLWWGIVFPEPALFDFDLQAGTVTGATCCPHCTVEIFSDGEDEGAHFEGQTTADGSGAFAFSKGAPLVGPHLTATVTDADGSTSGFSLPTIVPAGSLALQRGNSLAATCFRTRQSRELPDNHISGALIGTEHPEGLESWLYAFGVKRARVAINHQEPEFVLWDRPEFSIPPEWDAVFTRMADSSLKMKYQLTFWDKATYPGGEGLPCPRFKTQAEIDNYLAFVRFIVQNLKDRVEYYELWLEPDVPNYCTKMIEVADYVNLVQQTVPVIREEYPDAKIVVGSISLLRSQLAQDYLFTLLQSDIMPLVDAVSWHPFFSESPEYEATRDYWYAYPSLVQEIKDVASDHGFAGEYQVDALTWWRTGTAPPDTPWEYSPAVAAKYASRSIVMHLGTDIAVSTNRGAGNTLYNLCTAMSGAEPMALPVQIQSTATDSVSYTFSSPTDNHLVALWTDGVAADYDPGVTATVTIPGLADQRVTGIDVLHGLQQEVETTQEDGNLVIHDLLVKDYPILLRIHAVRHVYLPVVQKGHAPQRGTAREEQNMRSARFAPTGTAHEQITVGRRAR